MGWIGIGIGMDGSLGLVEYRAPYGANKDIQQQQRQWLREKKKEIYYCWPLLSSPQVGCARIGFGQEFSFFGGGVVLIRF